MARGSKRQQQARRANEAAGSAAAAGDFEAFYQRRLVPQIGKLEVERKQVVRRIAAWLALIVPAGSLLTGILVHVEAYGIFVSLAIAGTLGGALAALGLLRINYDANFKARVIQPLIAFYDPGLTYRSGDGIPLQVFVESRLFPGAPPERFSGEDLITGTLGKTRMSFSEVTAQRVRQVQSGKGETRESVSTIFSGVFFCADFNKNFSGATFVLPDRAQKLLGAVGQLLQSWEKNFGQIVKLEDPEFEQAFVVYSDSQIEARYILTPALMRRILEFHRRTGRPFRISFAGTRVNVAIDMGRNLFEARLFRTLLEPSLYATFWHDLTLLAGIVEELNLNTRIWTRA
jgi:hypothetical protein